MFADHFADAGNMLAAADSDRGALMLLFRENAGLGFRKKRKKAS